MQRSKNKIKHEVKEQLQMRIGDGLRLFNSSLGLLNASKNEVKFMVKNKINHELEKIRPQDNSEIDELRSLVLDQASRLEELEKIINSSKTSKAKHQKK